MNQEELAPGKTKPLWEATQSSSLSSCNALPPSLVSPSFGKMQKSQSMKDSGRQLVLCSERQPTQILNQRGGLGSGFLLIQQLHEEAEVGSLKGNVSLL